MTVKAIDLNDKLALFSEHWQPKIVGSFNGHDLMVVKIEGEFVWHSHPETDDFFLVLKGHLTIETDEGNVDLEPGQLYVVPRGVGHRPVAHGEVQMLLIEREGTPNTGDLATAVTKVRI